MESFRADDGAELAFVEGGSGKPALALVHGWQADHTVWTGVIEALGPQMHTFAADLRGNGESMRASGPYCLERYARDLHELVDARGAGPVVVVGHSMGGTVALRFAVDYPQATRGLVLVAPVPASGGGYSPKGEAYLRATAGDPVAVRNWLARTLANPESPALDRLCAIAAKADRDVALESFESWAHADFAALTQSIEAPALVIAPEKDGPEATEQRVAALLPRAQYIMLLEAAHYAIVEQPKEIAALISAFVSERGSRGADV
jgi:pimeloyl-ACP methyl ester carboxylesterase